MSLGPAGASLNPEQTQNFEDVRSFLLAATISRHVDELIDGKTIRRQRSALQSARGTFIAVPHIVRPLD